MSNAFVLNTDKTPLNPVHPGRARLLLTQGKAAVFRHYPFTIIMKEEMQQPEIEPLRLKIDPGSKATGLAVVNDATGEVMWAAELAHRGQAIKARLGDLVRAAVPSGKHAGVHVGCVTIRQRPSFRLNGHDLHPRYLTRLQKADGYAYAR